MADVVGDESYSIFVATDGCYEWLKETGSKQPYFVHRKDDRSLAFVGLWNRWDDEEGRGRESCTVLTRQPNAGGGPPDWMPVVLPGERYDAWLRPGGPARGIETPRWNLPS